MDKSASASASAAKDAKGLDTDESKKAKKFTPQTPFDSGGCNIEAPMDQSTAGWLGGIAGGIIGALISGVVMSCDNPNLKNVGIVAACTGLLGGALGYFLGKSANESYRNHYNTVNGKDIFGCAIEGNTDGVKSHLHRSACSYDQDYQGRTPLIYAAANGRENTARYLADYMPQSIRVKKGVSETSSTSVQHDVGSSFVSGVLSLAGSNSHLAVGLTGDPKTAKVVQTTSTTINYEDVNPRDIRDKSHRRTAVMWALRGYHYRTAAMLMRHGADGDIKDSEGHNVGSFRATDSEIDQGLTDANKSLSH